MNLSLQNEGSHYLTFQLAGEQLAIEVANVREVIDFTPVTRVPRMPDYLKGVINLRGNVIPVIDTRKKLEMEMAAPSPESCIVIVETRTEGDLTTITGILADSVSEVIDIDESEIVPAPRMGTGIKNEYVKGMGKKSDQFLIILDIDRMLSESDEQRIIA